MSTSPILTCLSRSKSITFYYASSHQASNTQDVQIKFTILSTILLLLHLVPRVGPLHQHFPNCVPGTLIPKKLKFKKTYGQLSLGNCTYYITIYWRFTMKIKLLKALTFPAVENIFTLFILVFYLIWDPFHILHLLTF